MGIQAAPAVQEVLEGRAGEFNDNHGFLKSRITFGNCRVPSKMIINIEFEVENGCEKPKQGKIRAKRNCANALIGIK